MAPVVVQSIAKSVTVPHTIDSRRDRQSQTEVPWIDPGSSG